MKNRKVMKEILQAMTGKKKSKEKIKKENAHIAGVKRELRSLQFL